VPCSTCYEEGEPSLARPGTGYRSLSSPGGVGDAIRGATRTASHENGVQQCSQLEHRLNYSPALDTPPESPRLAALQIPRSGNGHRRDSSFRKTYDENDRKRAIPCENCALTLPKKVKEQIPDAAPTSTEKGSKGDCGSPILRTRKPYERVSMAPESTSPKSSSFESDESERDPLGAARALKRTTTSSSISSFSSSNSQYHNHYLDYTSTHDPISSASFSILRASCLRTLSCETLPPTSTMSSAPASPSYRYFPTISSTPLASTSGGPIFFGDSLAGYTTAYIFRIPDPYARGRRRVYAFICVTPARESAAMRAFPFLSAAFRDLATWIQSLAEVEADRMDSTSTPPLNPNPDGEGLLRSSLNTAAPSLLQYPSSARSPIPSPIPNPKPIPEKKSSTFTPTSSFLSGRPYDLDGFPRKGLASLRSRGLAELVGRADFFIELHARFVALLAQLAALFAGTGATVGA
jgi:Vesicle coat protein involved in Golgi to plasma membrane transport